MIGAAGGTDVGVADKQESVKCDSTATPSPSTLRQKAWGLLKKPFAGRPKHSRQLSKKAPVSTPEQRGGTPGGAAEADASAKSTAADKQQQKREGAVSMTAATGTAAAAQLQSLPQHQAVRSQYGNGVSDKTERSSGSGTLLSQHIAAAEQLHAADTDDLQKAPEILSADAIR